MRTILLLSLLIPITALAQRTRALEELAYWMNGSFTSAEQAKADTNYREIELEMVRIWPKRRDGAWFYVEQATATAKEKPYRQRVYHVEQVNDTAFTSTILSIKGGEAYYGAYSDPDRLNMLSTDSLETLEGCSMRLVRKGNAYFGSTRGRECLNSWGEASYATSEVTIMDGRMISWDRGYNDAGEQVWGATEGGYRFYKRTGP